MDTSLPGWPVLYANAQFHQGVGLPKERAHGRRFWHLFAVRAACKASLYC